MLRPLILAVTSEIPWPLNSGGHLRTFHLLRALAARFRVHLVAGVAGAVSPDAATALAGAGIDLVAAPLPGRTWLSEGRHLAAATVAGDPYVFFRRHDWATMHAAVADAVRSEPPAVLYLDHLDGFLFAHHRGDSLVALDLHNVYSQLADRMAHDASLNLARRWFMRGEAGRLARTEARAVLAADLVCAVSDEDARHFAGLRGEPVTVVPNGVDMARYAALPAGREGTGPDILFVGSMDWPPNVEAVNYLATQVLPSVRAEIRHATLTIVGRAPSAQVQQLAQREGVRVAGAVPDVVPYLRDAALLAVPLESGGGTRLKILEAFAAGLPVVSTPVGCEGITARDGVELLIAPRQSFSATVSGLLQEPSRGTTLARHARALAAARYDWGVVGAALVEAVAALVADRGRAASASHRSSIQTAHNAQA